MISVAVPLASPVGVLIVKLINKVLSKNNGLIYLLLILGASISYLILSLLGTATGLGLIYFIMICLYSILSSGFFCFSATTDIKLRTRN